MEIAARAADEHLPAGEGRTRLLAPLHADFCRRMGLRVPCEPDLETGATRAPHRQLRQLMETDPALEALLPGATARIALGAADGVPFLRRRSGVLLVPATLMADTAAIAAAVRWGLEAPEELEAERLTLRLSAILCHGIALLGRMPEGSRGFLLRTLPPEVARELAELPDAPSARLLAWQASLFEGLEPPDPGPQETFALPEDMRELAMPIEAALAGGGDSRLQIDPVSGFNRYGVPPRPRPEAVHFSSSTASAITDYGFLFCDLLRRAMLAEAIGSGADPRDLRARCGDATGQDLLALAGLDEAEADAVLAPSGTDIELVTVMLALAAGGQGVQNILISPAETGRGVGLAASGRYFDPVAATGAPVRKEAEAWPGLSIETTVIQLRDDALSPRGDAEVEAECRAAIEKALADRRQVILHVLASSKTGLYGPSAVAVEQLRALSPDRIDVAVDACQMRLDPPEIGAMVRRGWMVQITGSKFLTGPPFCGAMLFPRALRGRADAVTAMLQSAPGVSRAEDWPGWWAGRLPVPETPPSFGPVYRWRAAIMEARLLATLPRALLDYAARRFRTEILAHIDGSDYLQILDTSGTDGEWIELSIVSFAVAARQADGGLQALAEDDCKRLFAALNRDLGALFDDPLKSSIAAQEAHIGQPVLLSGSERTVSVLRIVLGARFFTIVGHAGPGTAEAALESEIADAKRALSKLELLAAEWPRIEGALP